MGNLSELVELVNVRRVTEYRLGNQSVRMTRWMHAVPHDLALL